MAVVAKGVETRGPKIAREIAIVCLQTVVLATPVGNKALWSPQAQRRARPGYVGGRARANWLIGINSAHTNSLTIGVVDPSGASTIAAGSEVINGTTPGVEIHITNNLPYIVPLNEGHSKQAPAGFVEVAVETALQAVKNKRVLPT